MAKGMHNQKKKKKAALKANFILIHLCVPSNNKMEYTKEILAWVNVQAHTINGKK